LPMRGAVAKQTPVGAPNNRRWSVQPHARTPYAGWRSARRRTGGDIGGRQALELTEPREMPFRSASINPTAQPAHQWARTIGSISRVAVRLLGGMPSPASNVTPSLVFRQLKGSSLCVFKPTSVRNTKSGQHQRRDDRKTSQSLSTKACERPGSEVARLAVKAPRPASDRRSCSQGRPLRA
jgi:hypothetical protein